MEAGTVRFFCTARAIWGGNFGGDFRPPLLEVV